MKHKKVELPLPHQVRIQYVRPIFSEQMNVGNSWRAHQAMRSFIGNTGLDHKEFFWIMLVSHASRLLGISHISTGSVKGTVVSVTEILQLAILTNASGVILVHNHPSGSLQFSKADMKLTKNLKRALRYMEIQLLDHLVITTEAYISMADENIL